MSLCLFSILVELVQNSTPEFWFVNLEPETTYTIQLYTQTTKGKHGIFYFRMGLVTSAAFNI